MDTNKTQYGNNIQRHLASLKLVSRLLGHEMHSQGGAKTVTLTREEVVEIQTTIDLFIESVARTSGLPAGSGGGPTAIPVGETHLVSARN